jgi:hypothetical protein
MPDYTKAITPIDNCQIDYFYQYPESGFMLQEGVVHEVSIVAGDVTGNERTIKFNVILVDTIPPVFQIDTILFNSVAQYQNEHRTWHLYNWITASGDTLQSPNGFGFWGYYTMWEVAHLTEPCEPTSMRFVPWDSIPEDHPLYLVR